MDAKSIENFEFIDREQIEIDLALGFMSDENRITRQEMIIQTQTAFATAMMQLDPSVPEMFEKLRRPYEDKLYVLGIKDADNFLPTFEEAQKIAASKAKQPNPQADLMNAKTKLDQSKAVEAQSIAQLNAKKTQDIDIDNMFEAMAAKKGKLSAVQMD
jgi:hypothetical protein